MGLTNSAVATHSLNLDHRIDFKNSSIVYRETDTCKRRVVEGALIHSLDTFCNNKSFSEEDDIISHFISKNVVKMDVAANSLVVSSFPHAQARDDVVPRLNPVADTEAGLNQDAHRILNNQQHNSPPPLRRSVRLRDRLTSDQYRTDHPPIT